jgi:hypothetical protein
MSHFLIDRNGQIQEEQEPSAKLCLGASEHMTPSEFAIEALGNVISV